MKAMVLLVNIQEGWHRQGAAPFALQRSRCGSAFAVDGWAVARQIPAKF
jgi:hypothetical protein